MVKWGIPPSHSLYASLICPFVGIREVEITGDLYREAKKKGLLRDPDVFLKMVLMYVEVTVDIVEEMVEMKIKVTDCIFGAIINGYAKTRGLFSSLKSYEKLKSLKCETGQVTYASMINVYCRLGLYPNAESMFVEMLERGFHKCVVAYSTVVSMYGKNGRDRDAMWLLAKMKEKGCEPNVWVYNSLLDMHGRLLNLRQVGKLWKEMKVQFAKCTLEI
ncbi:Pentatricopeptide repeat-containing protein [Platanthera guangdongensis]|uniref:Pentatricopeptide repeat-containing protein n=1 Tax=Platanthera guangdongensis TaxID=2320717 RepID=A0ABR2LR11_9ASPA